MAVATVHPRAWKVAETQRRVGSRLLLRLRADDTRVSFRECEAEQGQGREGRLVEEGDFRRLLESVLLRQVWGWSGDVVVVLRREMEGWREEDSAPTAPTIRAARTAELPRTRSGTTPAEPTEPSRLLVREREESHREVDAERWPAVEAKLEEYLQWGMRLMETHAAHLRRIAPGHLLTEHPLREQSIHALVNATLAWAYSHTEDPDFLRRSPSEVALYLLASRSALATAIELGKRAPPHLDYTPPPVDEYSSEELLLELAVGLVPLLGESADLTAALSGYSLTGHRLSESERFISLFGVLLPLANGRLLKEGGDAALQRVAFVTGRSLDEVQVLSRVAAHLGPEDVHEIERLLRAASAGRSFTQEELEFLNRVARGLDTPLREASEALRRGEKVAMLGSRTLPDGSRLLPGAPAHLAQCWVDYQFRHPLKYRRFSYAVDPEWERLYRSILANKPAGNAFEESILEMRGYTKNTAMMVPPPAGKAQGFIPDSVGGNPGELVWGKPYSFVEAKARNELAFTGNLKAMLEYVREYGGHLELWVRSAQHPAGKTNFTRPLQNMLLELRMSGRVTLKPHP
ncbi:hypothetical protein [Archangium lipolyticum]|uniref:hypothetical protein n=1 Tax=Archangium lipolyticum TaxID=2970465 RepID=UPI002149F4DE|nr:hypothetical protein [Archangium lipolyticum]